ncbi:TetR/AcrR family transcriptional regulator [Agromyces soli]|uniref:TetR/AcrR family transcriptional regulator n=1 Tax=Agromyces soli TaxID=659012 RepID=A0ABY4AQ45_9MICO|nr:TetR/AcrR family transcriptional regulator [Agromyces soli]UOE24929.1 TetR/AcrR family transcriptional regulator [Agromyces soli]
MARGTSSYHRELATSKRVSVLAAATELFLEDGYDRTSLARIAERAGVSKATLFKQFPTKAALFEATVLAAGGTAVPEPVDVPLADFAAGLVVLGRAYAELVTRPEMTALMRTVIAESPRFPELRDRTFDFGTLPVLAALGRYLRDAHAAGVAEIDDPDTASAQFLGMIASSVFWPRLVHGTWSITSEEQEQVIEAAARTIAARYGAP